MDNAKEVTIAMHDLKCGEMLVSHGITIGRVPGGWIYSSDVGCAFIPWSDEFQPNKDTK